MFEIFNLKGLLAFAPTVLPALKLLGTAHAPSRDRAEIYRHPSQDVADGFNPYRVWMDARGIDLRTVARRMDESEDFVAHVLLMEPRADDIPYVSASTIVKFCHAIDVKPIDLAPLKGPRRPDIVEAMVAYNRSIICGFDHTTNALRGECMTAVNLGEGETGSSAILAMCEKIYRKGVGQPKNAEASPVSEHQRILDTIYGAAKYVRSCADGKTPPPFAVYADARDDATKLPAFRNGEFGLGVAYTDTDGQQRRRACEAWITALHEWYVKPETKAFLQAAANARYIHRQNFGIRSGFQQDLPRVGCP